MAVLATVRDAVAASVLMMQGSISSFSGAGLLAAPPCYLIVRRWWVQMLVIEFEEAKFTPAWFNERATSHGLIEYI